MDNNNENSDHTENYRWYRDRQGNPLALWISGSYQPDHTLFLTPEHFFQQVGFVHRGKGGEIGAHLHTHHTRDIAGTSEFLFLRKGRVSVDLYSDGGERVSSFIMEENDILLLVGGGHGFSFIEEGYFVEVKQGPYIGRSEKERIGKS